MNLRVLNRGALINIIHIKAPLIVLSAQSLKSFIIFLAGLRPRPLGRTERTLWRQAKGFLVYGLGRGANPFPILVTRSVSPCFLLIFERTIQLFFSSSALVAISPGI